MFFGHFWPTYLVLLYNVPFLGQSWTPLPTPETPEVKGQGGMCPQVLGYQLNLFGPRGAGYTRHIPTCPPIFLDDTAFLSQCHQNTWVLECQIADFGSIWRFLSYCGSLFVWARLFILIGLNILWTAQQTHISFSDFAPR